MQKQLALLFLLSVTFLLSRNVAYSQFAKFQLTISDSVKHTTPLYFNLMGEENEYLTELSRENPSWQLFVEEGIYQLSTPGSPSVYVFLENDKTFKATYNRKFTFEDELYPKLLASIIEKHDNNIRQIYHSSNNQKPAVIRKAFQEYADFLLTLENPYILDWVTGFLFDLEYSLEEHILPFNTYQQFYLQLVEKFPNYEFKTALSGLKSYKN